jgi:hypothetical protein
MALNHAELVKRLPNQILHLPNPSIMCFSKVTGLSNKFYCNNSFKSNLGHGIYA